MTTNYPKKLNYKPEGRRNIGRPQTRWGYEQAKVPKPYSCWWTLNTRRSILMSNLLLHSNSELQLVGIVKLLGGNPNEGLGLGGTTIL